MDKYNLPFTRAPLPGDVAVTVHITIFSQIAIQALSGSSPLVVWFYEGVNELFSTFH